MIPLLLASIALFNFGARSANADYHSVLTGVRLHLSSTTIDREGQIATMDPNGLTQVVASKKQIRLPSSVVEGYLVRLNTNRQVAISSATRPQELADNWVHFVFRDELVRLKYPRGGLARTRTPHGLLIPIPIIKRVERLPGPFDGDAGMGEPFFVLPWQAKLMSAKPPFYSCSPATERREIEWISYNKTIGEEQVSQLCESYDFDTTGAAPLVKKGKFFAIIYPAD